MTRSTLRADPRHGPLPALLLALTVVSGVMDAVSVLALGRVFVSNMTGNVVFIGFALAGVPEISLRGSVAALVCFLIGAMLGGVAVTRFGAHRGLLLRNVVAAEAVLIAVCLLISMVVHLREGGPVAATVVAGLAALAMGMQNATARRIGVPDMTTSVMTITLAGLAAEHRHGPPRVAGAAVGERARAARWRGGRGGAGAEGGEHVALGTALALLVGVVVAAALVRREQAAWQR